MTSSVPRPASSRARTPSGSVHWSSIWPKGKPTGDRNSEGKEVLGEKLLESERAFDRIVPQIGESSHGHAGQSIERADRAKMGEHAVHPVQILVHLLQDENRADEIGKPSRADEALEQRKIATGEGPLGDPLAHGDHRLARYELERPCGLGARQHSLEVASAERGHRLAGDRSVVGDHSRDLIDAGKQSRDVRKADHGARATRERFEIHLAEYASQAIPTPQAPDRVDALITKGVVEIGKPVGIGAGEIPVPACRMGGNHRFVIQRTAEPHGPRYIVGSK